MARFRMTVIGSVYGDRIKKGDMIIVEAQHETQITGLMVKEAVKQQLGKNMFELFTLLHKGKKWDITKLD